jgi:hypothetical protein
MFSSCVLLHVDIRRNTSHRLHKHLVLRNYVRKYISFDLSTVRTRLLSILRPSVYLCFSIYLCVQYVGLDSPVCIATRYGLVGPGIESLLSRDFSQPSGPAMGPTESPIQWVPGLSRGKSAGAWRWPPTPSRAEAKERVELYIYSPSGPSWPVLGWNLSWLLCVQYVIYVGLFRYVQR